MIYFDLDGVLRDLCGLHSGPAIEWSAKIKGRSLKEHLEKYPEDLLASKKTKFFDLISARENISIISHQPMFWRSWTDRWLARHFGRREITVIYVPSGGDCKLEYLKPGDWLVEDYPMFSDYSRIALIDYPYNRHVKAPVRISRKVDLHAFLQRQL